MGLSAVVFRDSAEELDEALANAPLGNIATIAWLRERAERLLAPDSVILSGVLYSATHSGDEIKPDVVPALQAEIRILQRDNDPHVAEFCSTLNEIANVAFQNGKAISFV